MRILSIETSCDETAISLIETNGDFPTASYKILGNTLFSQINIHREFGGVFPALAKREHISTLIPLLRKTLTEASENNSDLAKALALNKKEDKAGLSPATKEKLAEILSHETAMLDEIFTFFQEFKTLPVDLIAVTEGPGLEPALWVGVNFAKALAYFYQIKAVGVDHMEGHILASIFSETDEKLLTLEFPSLALLVSGGHTEMILIENWSSYKKIGKTRDDAIGETFDKVARMLGLPYPGGPEISRLAKIAREKNLPSFVKLPKPMLHSGNFDFSFSGLKTAVLYSIKDKTLNEEEKQALARDFEETAISVLVGKLKTAILENSVNSVVVGGGVSANQFLRQEINNLKNLADFSFLEIHLPAKNLTTDNSLMIALAGHKRKDEAQSPSNFILTTKASGNKSL